MTECSGVRYVLRREDDHALTMVVYFKVEGQISESNV